MLGLKIGIDLGTTTTVIYVGGRGIVLSEASVVAFDDDTGEIVAMGEDAKRMREKNPDTLRVVSPLRDGVISDLEVTEQMLRKYIKRICKYRIFKPNVIVCTPSGVTTLEKRTLLSAITSSGAGRACVMEEPLAAIIGAKVKINSPQGILVADIGGGTTDVAVVTMGNIAISNSIKVAGNAMDEAIQRYVRRERDILIGLSTAEELKKTIGCAYLPTEEIAVTCKGKNFIGGMPCSFEITSTEVYLAIRECVEKIAESIRETLECTPPELVADIYGNGLILTGGGAKIYGLEKMLSERLSMRVKLADEPELCVAKGIGYGFKNMQFMKNNGYIFRAGEDVDGYID